MSNLIEYIANNAGRIPGEFWAALGEMSPYLLFGFLMAGVLSVFVSPQFIERHLGGRGLLPVIKASAFGVPLPLCSCSVIPVSASLSRHGASRGAVVGFLLSTPQTGVDSIMVTLSMLGPVVAVYRPIAALLSGIFGGWAADIFSGRAAQAPAMPPDENNCQTCAVGKDRSRIVRMLQYGFLTLPADIGKALLLGLVVSALIAALLPKDYFSTVLPPGPLQMLVMMAAGIPVYVCATASVPIAAALMATGVSPGAAFAFLVTGPAVNAATLTTVWKILGRRSWLIYLLVVVTSAIGGGVILDCLVTPASVQTHVHKMSEMLPAWVGNASAIALLGLLVFGIVRSIRDKIAEKPTGHTHEGHGGDGECRSNSEAAGEELRLRVTGMTCGHCAASVERALRACSGVSAVSVDIAAGTARIHGEHLDAEKLIEAVKNSGYAASRITTLDSYKNTE